MSPQDVPTAFQGIYSLIIFPTQSDLLVSFTDFQHHGSLFTLFLHSPLTAFCYVCNVGDVPVHHWERCQGL